MNTKTVSLLFGLLLFAAPAWALNYTGLAEFDLSSIRFSGVSFTSATSQYSQSAWVSTMVLERPGEPDADHSGDIEIREALSRSDLVRDTVTNASLPDVGDASAFSDAASMASLLTMNGPGFLTSSVEWFQLIHPTETGLLTVSLDYTLSHINAPPDAAAGPELADFSAALWTQLSFRGGQFDAIPDHTLTTLFTTPGGETSLTGTVSVTQRLIAGVESYLGISTGTVAYSRLPLSVPQPDLFWPTALSLLALAGLHTWRQRARGGILSLAVLCLVAGQAWALEPDRYENINRTWSASPQGNGKTVYSDGFNTIEVSPSGPNSSHYNAWSADGQNTIGTIYGPSGSVPPLPSLYERLGQDSPSRSRPDVCGKACAELRR